MFGWLRRGLRRALAKRLRRIMRLTFTSGLPPPICP
jgi:hypothetical protein